MANENNIRNPKGRFEKVSGTLFVMALAILVLPFVAGCSNECNECPDPAGTNAPPFPPDGVFSITGNGQVEICWTENWERDIAGYAVYRDDDGDGLYDWLDDVDPVLGDVPTVICYTDYDVTNGVTYDYAVLAFDNKGQESELSYEAVFDTPRPEGLVVLSDYLGQSAAMSGWDFSEANRQRFDSTTTDIYFGTLTDQQTSTNVSYIFTAAGVDIQDYGYIADEDEFAVFVDWAPEQGWSNLGRTEAVQHHAFIVRIDDPADASVNYAKIWVASVTNDQVTMRWAYQPSKTEYGNRELVPARIPMGGAQP
jgi:hypothetical protein